MITDSDMNELNQTKSTSPLDVSLMFELLELLKKTEGLEKYASI